LPDNFKPIMLRDFEACERINQRMDIISEMINPEQVVLKGTSKLSKLFYGILFGDFTSYYLALAQGNNPGQQPKIDALKKRLKD